MAKRKRNNTLLIILGIALVALIGVLAYTRQNQSVGKKVTAEEVSERTIMEQVSASGKVFPVTEVKISSDVSGEIVELYVEEGDSVVANQVLAKIDPDAFQSQVERGAAAVNGAKAQLANSRASVENFMAQKEQIEAQLINAKEIFNRNKQLKEEGVVSIAEYESAEANLRALEANLRSAEANIRAAEQSVEAAKYNVTSTEASLKELRTSLRRTTIYAPVNGIVSMLSVEQGERVVGTIQMTGTELMRIANLNAMEVQVEVSENDIPRVSIGDKVDIEVDAYIGRVFKGTVSQIANSASNAATAVALTTDQVTNFVVTVNIDPNSYKDLISPGKQYPFRPGMSASVEINTEVIEGALSIPIQAVAAREWETLNEGEERPADQDELVEIVYIVEGDTVRPQEVTTGIQDDTYIQVVSGLNSGQTVVTGPYTEVSKELESGQEVEMVEEDELYKKD
ncbi:MAG: efflux RND transporter periplasmic adaptor subunit [Bacteroidota bacterium]